MPRASPQPIGRGNAPVLDGRLDEPAWQAATLIEDFHQIEPIEYAETAERTLVRIYYDDDALYIGARMFDSQPDAINANVLRQGAQFWRDDFFAVIISPFNDQRNGYRFQLNPNGVRMEMLLLRNEPERSELERHLARRSEQRRRRVDRGDRDPIPDVVLQSGQRHVGDQFRAGYFAALQEHSGWVSRNLSQNPSIAGEAVGFEGLQLGRGLDIVPSLTLRNNKNYEAAVTETNTEPSLDVYYKFTPSLNGSLDAEHGFLRDRGR